MFVPRAFAVLCPLAVALCSSGQTILTDDIPRFWEAYDSLATAKNGADSVACFQRLYLDRASEGLRRFMKVRDLSASHYVQAMKARGFWRSVRAGTLRIEERRAAIERVFATYERELPGFKRPSVCFAIGHLSTGGTTSGDWILIGSEIVCADSTTDTHELNAWLRSVIKPVDQVMPFIAHEAIHVRQRHGPRMIWAYFTRRLQVMSMMEGTADFVAREVAGVSINEQLRAYGEAHEAELWMEFRTAMHGNDLSGWLYQGTRSRDRPADLGYFMGERIGRAYYLGAQDRRKALKTLLRSGSAGRVVRRSGYAPGP